MCPAGCDGSLVDMTNSNTSRNTAAFYAQSAISFGLSLCALLGAVLYLDVNAWIRAFIAVDALWMVSSAFTLAKCVRDQQEDSSVISRLDSARLERLLAEFDPYRVPDLANPAENGPQHGNAPHPPLQYPPAPAR